MKIKCECMHLIVDQTDYLKYKGYLISDTQWFDLWEAIDNAIEKSGESMKEIENTCMQLRKLRLFKSIWECTNCGKLFIDGPKGELISYSPDSKKYNKVVDKNE